MYVCKLYVYAYVRIYLNNVCVYICVYVNHHLSIFGVSNLILTKGFKVVNKPSGLLIFSAGLF